jgi:hypothetical protein
VAREIGKESTANDGPSRGDMKIDQNAIISPPVFQKGVRQVSRTLASTCGETSGAASPELDGGSAGAEISGEVISGREVSGVEVISFGSLSHASTDDASTSLHIMTLIALFPTPCLIALTAQPAHPRCLHRALTSPSPDPLTEAMNQYLDNSVSRTVCLCAAGVDDAASLDLSDGEAALRTWQQIQTVTREVTE